MSKRFIFSTALAVWLSTNAAGQTPVPAVTPAPAAVTTTEGVFVTPPQITYTISAPAEDAAKISGYLAARDGRYAPSAGGTVQLKTVDTLPGVTSPEGYRMEVTPEGIIIEAMAGDGLFHGLTTLLQLTAADSIPAMTITDEPRFGYRGMMLDISRNFRDKEFIKKQIDIIAALKLNRLHLHLTDAAGWRLEIKKYPELTEYAAWRPQQTWKEWSSNGAHYTHAGSPDAHGGFLTQEDAKEIVKYAADRYITVIPEIEMPSHSEEVTATFPQLSCTHNPNGQPDVCVGNDSTFIFFENVLDEVMDIFPSKDIHIGGDEANKGAWADCELCKKRMADEGLENVDELQSYMIERIEKYLNSKGRNLIGWDEIMEGGLAPNATVMSWRGTEGGIRAAHGGHKAIMSPGGYCYLDSYQDAPHTQPEAISGYLPLEKVYSYNPVPDTLAAEVKPYIYGVQGNLWTEYVPTAEHAEYMLYPRMLAIAEVGWTPQERKDWDDFYQRALAITDSMRSAGINAFDIRNAVGSRPESREPIDHLAKGKKVTYNVGWWRNYTAGGDTTLTDGLRGDWNYTDGRWQGFLARGDNRVDVVIDLEKETDISYVGGDFMQIIGPGVWLPAKVEISVSNDGKDFTMLKEIEHEQKPTEGLSFMTFSWDGKAKARYVRFRATSSEGCQFLDEIVVR